MAMELVSPTSAVTNPATSADALKSLKNRIVWGLTAQQAPG